MKYTKFNSPGYKWQVLSFVSCLLVWNLYHLVHDKMWIALFSIAIQSTIIFLILKQHQYARSIIMWWSLIFFVVPSLLQRLGAFLPDPLNDFIDLDTSNEWRITRSLIGLYISLFANKTLEVIEEEPVVLGQDQ